uniref:Cytokine-like nuclear factor N-PAC n=1 Tax=Timema monikensis TaxID=170555 RepID=A0A7R9DZF3_9NEOP|nr:unnamed protein product [Timema monikensis]
MGRRRESRFECEDCKDNPSKIVKRTLSDKSNGVSPAKMVRSNSVNNDEIQKTSGASTSFCTISPRKPTTSNLLDRPANIQRPSSVWRPFRADALGNRLVRPALKLPLWSPIKNVTPHLDLKKVTETLKNKNICPSSMKFGFLGLGIMGSGIVKNLLHSGHTVIVWNRNPDKCRDFVNAGATQGQTPSDVIFAADVTFSCITNPDAAKELVFGNCGVLAEIKNSKGYVEMTGIDAETSRCIGEAIVSRGGRYLEAQIQGSKLQAELGTLVILAAGDHALYDDCQSCFTAMGKSSFFIGDVGNASMMNLIIQLISGVTIAGLAEGMALADRVGLSQNDVVEILELTQLNSMAEGGFPTHIPLAHIQKDLKLALLMADRMEQSLPLTAATNELFKHAKRLGYGGHDASAVYIRARF